MKRIVWDKVTMGMGYHYRGQYEFVMFFEKGSRRLNDLGIADVLKYKRVVGGYPTEKPQGLFDTLVRQSVQAGEVVLDPFCGGGAAGIAATKVGAHYILSDLTERAVNLTVQRLQAQAEKVVLL